MIQHETSWTMYEYFREEVGKKKKTGRKYTKH